MDKLVDRRHNQIAEKRQLYIELDPEIAQVFNDSNAVSTQQGSSYNLMKASAKRRRSKKQIEKEQLEEERRNALIDEKIARFDEMEAAVLSMQDKCQRIDNVDHAVLQLNRGGFIR